MEFAESVMAKRDANDKKNSGYYHKDDILVAVGVWQILNSLECSAELYKDKTKFKKVLRKIIDDDLDAMKDDLYWYAENVIPKFIKRWN